MYAFVISLILMLAASPAAANCCTAGSGDPPPVTGSDSNDPTLWKLYDGNGSLAFGAPNPNKPGSGPTPASGAADGVTCQFYNRAASLSWRNLGGDWIDANNTPQGNTPYVTAALPKATNYTFTINVTPVMAADGIVLRLGKSAQVALASREHGTAPYRPRLFVTLADTSVVEMDPTADTAWLATASSCSTYSSTGKSPNLTLGSAAFLQFPALPATAVSASLRLTALSVSLSTTIGVYAMSIPYSPITPVTQGFSSSYPNDEGLKNDPRVVYFEGWDDDIPNWWARAGLPKKPAGTTLADGLFPVPSWSGVHIANGVGDFKVPGTTQRVPRTLGKYGNGLSYIMNPNVLSSGAQVPTAFVNNLGFPNEAEDLYFRYYWKAEDNFRDFMNCEGGKLPGLAGSNITGGNSGQPANGLNGWTMRLSFSLICDPSNPAYGRVNIFNYAYHADMPGLNGQHWHMREPGLLKRNRWYCIEQRVKVNTPGVRDGLLQTWIDGRIVTDRTGLYLREPKPPFYGYGRWMRVTSTKPCIDFGTLDPATGKPRLCPTCPKITGIDGRNFCLSGERNPTPQLGINKAWGMVHNGGKNPTGVPAKATIDQTVVATERIGCGTFNQ